jgi:biopolymer transport protein ExbB
MGPLIYANRWMLLPIAGCSVAALAIVLERIARLTLLYRGVRQTRKAIDPMLAARRWGELRSACADRRDPLGALLRFCLDNHSREETPETRLPEALEEHRRVLERGFDSLSTIATVAPMLGLLGTVVGLIQVFTRMRTSEIQLPFNAIAGGLGHALVSTAAGLVVAIPSAVAYSLLWTQKERLLNAIEIPLQSILQMLSGAPSKRAAPAQSPSPIPRKAQAT